MSDNKFNDTVQSLFGGMENFFTTKTVVGDAVKFDDGTIVLPLVDVSFGVAAGAFSGKDKNNAGGGLGGKLSPSSVLVIKDGTTKLVNVKNQDQMKWSSNILIFICIITVYFHELFLHYS